MKYLMHRHKSCHPQNTHSKICHFIPQGTILQDITFSLLPVKSNMLLANWKIDFALKNLMCCQSHLVKYCFIE